MKKFSYIRIIVILLCTVGIAQFLKAQGSTEPYMKWITEEDGLPSNEVYHVIQDDKGYIWFATDDGIVKYDGKNFGIFNKSNGLPENVVFRLYKKESGSIIGECISNKYFALKNERIFPFKINDSISRHLGSANISFSYAQDNKGSHHFGTRYGMFSINENGKLLISPEQPYTVLDHDSLINGLALFNVNNTWLSAKEATMKKKSNPNLNFCLKLLNFGREFYYEFPDNFTGNPIGNSVHVIEIDSQKICLNYGNGILLIGKNGILNKIKLSSPTLDLLYFENHIFVCTESHGVYQIKIDGDDLRQVGHFLDGFSVTSGIRSTDGSFWFTTREKGVAQILDLNLTIEGRVFDDNISAVLLNSGLKIIGTEKGFVFINDKLSKKSPHAITAILKWNDGSFIALGTPNIPICFQTQKDKINWFNFNDQ